MEIENYNEAIKTFNSHGYTKENNFTPFFRWYLALANIKLKNKNEAISILEKLANTDNPQKDAAERLLDELK
jgi:hypothetical protein